LGSGSLNKKEAGSRSIFHKTWGRDVEAEAVEFFWKRKHFKEAGNGSKLESD